MSADEDEMEATIEERQAYRAGLIEGVTRFAWWKDGVQYVGTTGKTLAKAIDEIMQENL